MAGTEEMMGAVDDFCVTEKLLLEVANLIGRHWRPLAVEMGFPQVKIDTIEADNKVYGEEDMAMKMLVKWRDQNSSSATVGALRRHLYDIKQQVVADRIYKLLETEDGRWRMGMEGNVNE